MKPQAVHHDKENVIDLFSGKPVDQIADDIIRIAPEFDGLEMLYTNDSSPDKLYSLKVVCWCMKESGDVVGMVPWLNKVVPSAVTPWT